MTHMCARTDSCVCHDLLICVSREVCDLTWHAIIWWSHVMRVNESWHTYGWVVSHIWMGRVTHICECPSPDKYLHESRHTWVMAHVGRVISPSSPTNLSHVTLITHELALVMHIWMSHGTHMDQSEGTRMSHDTHMNESCHVAVLPWDTRMSDDTYVWVMSHSCACQARGAHVTHLHVTHVWHDTLIG